MSAFDRLLPHELTPDELATLQEVLGRQPDLAAAHLVRKELKHFPRQRLFVLSVRSGAHRWGWSRASRDAALVARLVPQVRLPGRVFVVASQPGFRALARKVARAPGAQVYPARPT